MAAAVASPPPSSVLLDAKIDSGIDNMDQWNHLTKAQPRSFDDDFHTCTPMNVEELRADLKACSELTTITTKNLRDAQKGRVLVIGAGPSGLAAIKEMTEAGRNVVCLEKAEDIGGAFRVAKDWSYDELYLTISNFFMAFSDFPPLEDCLRYSKKEDYFKYLQAYAKHFDLMKHIKLEHQVVSASLSEVNGTWKIVAKDLTSGGKSIEFTADTLIVATGSNHMPKTIPTPGFTGEVIHSSEYRNPKDFKGKHVLVIGSGESGADITHQVTHGGAASVTLYTRKPALFAPRFMSVAFDESEPYDEHALLKDGKGCKVSGVLELHTTSRLSGWIPPFFYAFLRHFIFWNLPETFGDGSKPRAGLLAQWCQMKCDGYFFKADQVAAATKNSFVSVLHAKGLISTVVAPNVTFDGKKVSFQDVIWNDKQLETPQKEHVLPNEIDTVFLCTGFQTDLSWIKLPNRDVVDVNARTWYKHCFPPKYGGAGKLFFLGWTRPHQGGIPTCSELLARYAAMVLNGERQLPTDYEARALKEGGLEDDYYIRAEGYQTLMDYPALTESVCDLIGCRPKCPNPLTNWERFVQFWVYPSWACWFRQNGPGSNPKVLDATLNKLPLKTSWDPDPIFFLSLPFLASNVVIATVLSSIPLVAGWYRQAGETIGWKWIKPRRHILNGNQVPESGLLGKSLVAGPLMYGLYSLRATLAAQIRVWA